MCTYQRLAARGGTRTAPAIGVLTLFVSGWIALWLLVNHLKRRSLLPFVVYRLVLAAVLAVF